MKNKFQKELISPGTLVMPVAYLDDLGGKKYFLKNKEGRYIWLDSDLESYEIVEETTVFSAIIKYDYQPVEKQEFSPFVERKKYL
jgi:hypothetical protein